MYYLTNDLKSDSIPIVYNINHTSRKAIINLGNNFLEQFNDLHT